MFIELNKFLTVLDWFKSSKIYFALLFLEVITWKFTKLVYMLLVTPGLFTTLPILERVLGIKPFLKLFASNWKKELDTCKGWICASFTKKYVWILLFCLLLFVPFDNLSYGRVPITGGEGFNCIRNLPYWT